MTLQAVTEMAYSIYLHKTKDYNAIKYNFKISKNMNQQLNIYFNTNKFGLNQLTQYTESEVKFRLLINYYINNSQIIEKISDKQYEIFKGLLLEYKNEFLSFISKDIVDVQSLYKEYIKGNVPFYIFYYVIRYVKFKESFLNFELIKNKLSVVCKLMLYFTHFNDEWIKDNLKDYQKKIELGL